MSEHGFIGPLNEVDQDDRCPLCGLDPLDPTLHGPTCPTVTQGICGVIEGGRMCMAVDHMTDTSGRKWEDHWREWSAGHVWVPLKDAAKGGGGEEVGDE